MDKKHWTDDYTGKTIEEPLRVKNLISMLKNCNGESTVSIEKNSEIFVTNKNSNVELHMPLVETHLEMNDGTLDEQSFDYERSGDAQEEEYKKIAYKIVNFDAGGNESEIGFGIPYQNGDIECNLYNSSDMLGTQKSDIPGYAEVFFLRKREDDV